LKWFLGGRGGVDRSSILLGEKLNCGVAERETARLRRSAYFQPPDNNKGRLFFRKMECLRFAKLKSIWPRIYLVEKNSSGFGRNFPRVCIVPNQNRQAIVFIVFVFLVADLLRGLQEVSQELHPSIHSHQFVLLLQSVQFS
jgi:hypothetical protein